MEVNQALKDELTGLYNSEYFYEKIKNEIEISHRYAKPYSIVRFDIDNFKDINDSYGFEFGNLSGLRSGTRGSFDSGNVYINLADTKSVLLPANYLFQTTRFGGDSGSFLTSATDYIQNIHTGTTNQNPYSFLVAIRGGEFQTISRRGRFTNSARAVATNNPIVANVPNINEHDGKNGTTLNSWGLALPFYNLNANMAMYGTKVDAATVYSYAPTY
ncbi:diguanylate cyclase, partial [bacterium]